MPSSGGTGGQAGRRLIAASVLLQLRRDRSQAKALRRPVI
jgi:hypothetical protein